MVFFFFSPKHFVHSLKPYYVSSLCAGFMGSALLRHRTCPLGAWNLVGKTNIGPMIMHIMKYFAQDYILIVFSY